MCACLIRVITGVLKTGRVTTATETFRAAAPLRFSAAAHTGRPRQSRMCRRTQQQRRCRGAVRKVIEAWVPPREPEGAAKCSRPCLKKASTAWFNSRPFIGLESGALGRYTLRSMIRGPRLHPADARFDRNDPEANPMKLHVFTSRGSTVPWLAPGAAAVGCSERMLCLAGFRRRPSQPGVDHGRRPGLRRIGMLRTTGDPDAAPGSDGERRAPLHAVLRRRHGLRPIPKCFNDRTTPRAHPGSRQRRSRQPPGPGAARGGRDGRESAPAGRLCHRAHRQMGPR